MPRARSFRECDPGKRCDAGACRMTCCGPEPFGGARTSMLFPRHRTRCASVSKLKEDRPTSVASTAPMVHFQGRRRKSVPVNTSRVQAAKAKTAAQPARTNAAC